MSDVWDENWFGSTKTLDVHIAWLRRKLGDDPAAPALHPHRARRRASVSRPTRSARRKPARSACSARSPTCCCWRSSRSACRWRSASARASTPRSGPQARAQADLVAATAADLLGRAAARRSSHRSRDSGRDARSAAACWSSIAAASCSPTAPGPPRSAPATPAGPRSQARCAGTPGPGAALLAGRSASRSSRPRCRSSTTAAPSGAVRVTQSVAAVERRGAPRRARPRR